jgi:hypothetical protein
MDKRRKHMLSLLKLLVISSLSILSVLIFKLTQAETGFEVQVAVYGLMFSFSMLILSAGFTAVVEAIEKLSVAKQESQDEADDVPEAVQ